MLYAMTLASFSKGDISGIIVVVAHSHSFVSVIVAVGIAVRILFSS